MGIKENNGSLIYPSQIELVKLVLLLYICFVNHFSKGGANGGGEIEYL
jgi:hypothetical protein